MKRILLYLKKNKWPYLFLLPFFLLYISFQLYPQVFSVMLAFQNYRIGRPTEFVGLRNFTRVLQDPVFYLAIRNTVFIWLGTLPSQLAAGFLIATAMLRLGQRARGLASGVFYLPVVTSLVAVALVFQLMYDTNAGVINHLLGFVGIAPISWLADPQAARFAVILMIFWRGVGYYIVFILAGLISIDNGLYEFATIEGAGYFKKHWYITLPLIKPIMLFLIFTGTIAGWNVFLEPFLLFGGAAGGAAAGPGSSGLTLGMFVYTEGILHRRYSYGAAISVYIAVITAIVAVVQFRFMGARGGRYHE